MKLSIIVPAWKGTRKSNMPIASFLDKIQSACEGIDHELIVVCNSQSTALSDAIRHSTEVSKFCLLSTNIGVARAWNVGADMAEGEVLCFVNEDVILESGTLQVLLENLMKKEDVGVIGIEGANLSIQDGDIHQSRRIVEGSPQYCDAVSGFLFLTKREVYHAVGGFDNALTPCSYEEIDFAFRIRNAGLRCYVVPGLKFNHPWGISVAKPSTKIEYMGYEESLRAINNRNRLRVVGRWKRPPEDELKKMSKVFNGEYYNDTYFSSHDYHGVMTKSRNINGKIEPPLAETMIDMIDSLFSAGGGRDRRIMDLACSYGYTVQELLKRGYDAFGMDFSADCVNNSPVKKRLMLGDIRALPLDQTYATVMATNLFEHLNDADAMMVIQRVRQVCGQFFTIINKSSHDPSHINLKPNWRWIVQFKKGGFVFDRGATEKARAIYKKKSPSRSERWHRDCLIFSAKQHNPNVFRGPADLAIEWVRDGIDTLIILGAKIKHSIFRIGTKISHQT